MENWNPSIVYDMAIARHTEVIARGEAAPRQSPLLGAPPARARIAAALVALAARLDPAGALPRREDVQASTVHAA